MNKDINNEITEIIKQKPDNLSIHWFYDKHEIIARTSICKKLILKYDAFLMSDRIQRKLRRYRKTRGNYPRIIMIDLYLNDKVDYGVIKGLKKGILLGTDRIKTQVFNSPHVIIFSNKKLKRRKTSSINWIVRNISKSRSNEKTKNIL